MNDCLIKLDLKNHIPTIFLTVSTVLIVNLPLICVLAVLAHQFVSPPAGHMMQDVIKFFS